MPRRPSRPALNITDPLAETTPQRRLWAAYLRRGLTRAEFQKELAIGYGQIMEWEKGKSLPSLEVFMRAARIVGYSAEELFFGRAGNEAGVTPIRKRGGVERRLTNDAIRTLLVEIQASGEQRAAFGVHQESAEGKWQEFTRTYVVTWIGAYAAAKNSGKDDEAAHAAALKEAVTAIGAGDAIARQAKPFDPEAFDSALRQALVPSAANDEGEEPSTSTMPKPTKPAVSRRLKPPPKKRGRR